MKKITAVVVTYNRCDLLKKCLDALEKQTYKLNKIVVIDNHSSDGTEEYLATKNNETYDVIRLNANLGGAGGFHYGVEQAYKTGCDYLWLMDDDTICEPNSLEKLMEAEEILKDEQIGFISSNVLFRDNTPCLMNIPGPVYMWNKYIEKSIVQVAFTSFVAMLIPINVVKEVGLPVKEYFIWGDDGDYSRRILKKYSGYLAGRSTVYHLMKENVGVNIFETDETRISRFFFFYRNTMASMKRDSFKSGLRFWLASRKLILKIIVSKTDKKIKKIYTIDKGVWTGLFMKYQIKYME